MALGYRMTARGNSEAEVLLYEDIGGWLGGVTAQQFATDLRALGAVSRLTVRINSSGGDVFDGLTIYQQLRLHGARKVVAIDSFAGSIASVIAMAGDEITIAKPARIMIHEAESQTKGAWGKHQEMANRLKEITGTLAQVYADRTGRPVAQIREWMAAGTDNNGTWFNAERAVAEGFAQSIFDGLRIAANYDPLRHEHIRDAPADLAPVVARPSRDEMAARVAAMRARLTHPAG